MDVPLSVYYSFGDIKNYEMYSVCRILGAKIGVYMVLVEMSGGRKRHGKPRQNLENSIKKLLQEIYEPGIY
jgi:hypothetical protein